MDAVNDGVADKQDSTISVKDTHAVGIVNLTRLDVVVIVVGPLPSSLLVEGPVGLPAVTEMSLLVDIPGPAVMKLSSLVDVPGASAPTRRVGSSA